MEISDMKQKKKLVSLKGLGERRISIICQTGTTLFPKSMSLSCTLISKVLLCKFCDVCNKDNSTIDA